MESNYQDRIPNNVSLGSNRSLQRALEHWQPEFLNWWHGWARAILCFECVFADCDQRGHQSWPHLTT